ncbi:unnamed protein product [Prorocentrum cordatum]|uniref:Uncharacterized protein n=1 Tax=Prorocentrum cordatum TaxID=2364126 RepID=A0ABN9WGC7_9DINO|nr:unnamed protein product [Polarella glacialis]
MSRGVRSGEVSDVEVTAGGAPAGGALSSSRASRRSRARVSADRLVQRLSGKLDQLAAQAHLAEEALALIVGNSEVWARLRAVVLAVVALVRGEEPQWLDVLRRNVALHAGAEDIDVEHASATQLRRAQYGPRLEERRRSPSRQAARVRAEAPEFVPRAPASIVGSNCTRGCALYSSCRWTELPTTSAIVLQSPTAAWGVFSGSAARGAPAPPSEAREGEVLVLAVKLLARRVHPPAADGSEGGGAALPRESEAQLTEQMDEVKPNSSVLPASSCEDHLMLTESEWNAEVGGLLSKAQTDEPLDKLAPAAAHRHGHVDGIARVSSPSQ